MLGHFGLKQESHNGLPICLQVRLERLNSGVHLESSRWRRNEIVLTLGGIATIVWRGKRTMKTHVVRRTIRIGNQWKANALFKASHDSRNGWLALRKWNDRLDSN
jgi:hypothetical protein